MKERITFSGQDSEMMISKMALFNCCFQQGALCALLFKYRLECFNVKKKMFHCELEKKRFFMVFHDLMLCAVKDRENLVSER